MDFPTLDLSPSALSLSACILLCAYLTWICTTPPNPPPPPSASGAHHDSLQSSNFLPIALHLRHLLLLLFYTPTILLILAPGPARTHCCLSPARLNPALLSWSPATLSFVGAIFVAAPIRMRAFAQLGLDFNFRLSEPARLVTRGLYARVQHPSYTALWVMSVATYLFALRADGVPACVLPAWAVRVPGLSGWGPALVALATTVGMGVRVREEERMLREVFGTEWEVYHGRTKRFLPGLL